MLHSVVKSSQHVKQRRCVDAGAGTDAVTNRSPGHSAFSHRNNVSQETQGLWRDSNQQPSEYEPRSSSSQQTAHCQTVLPEDQPAWFITCNTHANKCESKFSYLCKQIRVMEIWKWENFPTSALTRGMIPPHPTSNLAVTVFHNTLTRNLWTGETKSEVQNCNPSTVHPQTPPPLPTHAISTWWVRAKSTQWRPHHLLLQTQTNSTLCLLTVASIHYNFRKD